MTDKATLEEAMERISAGLPYLDAASERTDRAIKAIPRLLEICREQAAALEAAKAAMRDMLCGWKIIRAEGGEEKIYGIGWDRAQSKVEKALDLIG